jgi:YD repeat-containing protein
VFSIRLCILFSLVSACLFSGGTCRAQTTNPCYATPITYWFWDQRPAGWWVVPGSSGWFFYLITTHLATPECSPPPECPCARGGAASSGAAPAAGSTPTASKPVYLNTGDVYIADSDISIPGLNGGLSIQRSWNSIWPYIESLYSVGLFGPNWRSTYEERVFVGADNYLKYSRSDGGYWSFALGPSSTWVVASPINVAATLTQSSNTWTIVFQNGEQRQFSTATGFLTAIIDRNGNTTQLSYDSSNRLTTVTDPASRHLYFNYNGSSQLISSITSDFGVSVSYSYDTSGRLVQVTKPDLTTVSYTYNSQSLITQVTDTNGKVLESHTYDSQNRGLNAAQANGVNEVTITYP